MKVILIIKQMPTPDNYRGGTAHPYHLIKYRPEDIELEIYSFNLNDVTSSRIKEIEKELNVVIHVLDKPKWLIILNKLHLIYLKNFLSYPLDYYIIPNEKIVSEIKSKKPDGIWLWGDAASAMANLFEGYFKMLTMPDCVPLYYQRLLADRWILSSSMYRMIGNCIQYFKNVRMEREYPPKNICYHLVGEDDRKALLRINPNVDAHFIHHPHYNYSDKKVIRFSQPKIKILIAGKYDLYMKTEFDNIIPYLCNNQELNSSYSITFLGKGWDFAVKMLNDAGYESKRLGFVDVYLDEIIKYDIQLTPISVGTGTKGKVLDALANGLLEIGTPYALENIAVEDGRSCLIYHSPEELINILNDIPNDISHYETIAEAGRKDVLEQHDRKKVSSELFELFRKHSH